MFREEIAGAFRVIATRERPDDPWLGRWTGRGISHGAGTLPASDAGGLTDFGCEVFQRSFGEDRLHAEGVARGIREREP